MDRTMLTKGYGKVGCLPRDKSYILNNYEVFIYFLVCMFVLSFRILFIHKTCS